MRLTVANTETLVANAARRSLRLGEDEVVPRVSDLEALAASTSGKVEIETLDDRDERCGRAADQVGGPDRLPRALPAPRTCGTCSAPSTAGRWSTPATTCRQPTTSTCSAAMTGLRDAVNLLTEGNESPAAAASAVEFLLEGLHLSKRLNKDAVARARPTGHGCSGS